MGVVLLPQNADPESCATGEKTVPALPCPQPSYRRDRTVTNVEHLRALRSALRQRRPPPRTGRCGRPRRSRSSVAGSAPQVARLPASGWNTLSPVVFHSVPGVAPSAAARRPNVPAGRLPTRNRAGGGAGDASSPDSGTARIASRGQQRPAAPPRTCDLQSAAVRAAPHRARCRRSAGSSPLAARAATASIHTLRTSMSPLARRIPRHGTTNEGLHPKPVPPTGPTPVPPTPEDPPRAG